MKIADVVAKEQIVFEEGEVNDKSFSRSIKESSWNELKKNASSSIRSLHQNVFQNAFEILSKEKV